MEILRIQIVYRVYCTVIPDSVVSGFGGIRSFCQIRIRIQSVSVGSETCTVSDLCDIQISKSM